MKLAALAQPATLAPLFLLVALTLLALAEFMGAAGIWDSRVRHETR